MNSKYHLIESSIAKSTNNKYNKSLNNFRTYLHDRHRSLHKLNPIELDSILVDYFHYMFTIGGSYSSASYTISALKRNTGFGFQLHRANLCLKGWKQINEKKRIYRPPLTLESCTLIAITLCKNGYYSAGIATLVGFHCLLRINELCNIKMCEIIFTGDPRLGSGVKRSIYASIKLSITKTGVNQSVSITNISIATLLKDLIHYNNVNLNVGSHDLVFNMNAQTYRSLFKRACSSLGFESIGYTPHGLRHGGATYLHMNGIGVKNLMLIGRWRSQSSLTIYVQVGAVLLLDTKISVQMFNIAKLLNKHIVQTIRMIKNFNQ